MLWTILIIVAAVVLYAAAGMLTRDNDSKRKEKSSKIMCSLKKVVKLTSIVLLVWGVNRTGLGTHSYLVSQNPEVLQEMVESMKARQSMMQSKEIRKYVVDKQAELMKNAPIMGNVNGKKTIYLFAAHSCHYCQQVHHELERVVNEDKDVRVVLKQFSIHGPLSDSAARATIAAKLQSNDKAVELDRLLMEKPYWPQDMKNQDPQAVAKTVRANVMELAKKAGLDTEKLGRDMDTAPEVQAEFEQVRSLAQTFGISGTPYLIIGEQSFPGAISYDQIKSVLRSM